MEKKYGLSYHPLSKGIEITSPESEKAQKFPFEIFNLPERELFSLQNFFDNTPLYIQYHQDGSVHEYRPNKESRYPFVIRDIEKFQGYIDELYIALGELPKKRREWFGGAKFSEAHYFEDILHSATPEDFLFPENYIQKWIYLLKNTEFENLDEKRTLSTGSSFYFSKRLAYQDMEAPDEFTFKLEQDGEGIDLPLVRFGKTSEKEATIFSVQNDRIEGIPEGVAKKINNETWSAEFESMWKIVESCRQTLTDEEFVNLFGEDVFSVSKYEWFQKFNDYFWRYAEGDPQKQKKHPLFSIMMESSSYLKTFAKAKIAEPIFEAQREKRKELNTYLKGFLRGYGNVSVAHTISFLSSILVFASKDISYITVPVHYPLREHKYVDEREHPENFIDGKIFKQMAGMVRALCDKVDGIVLESVPDLDSSFRIRIEKDKLRCEKYPFIQSLIDEIVKK